MEFDYETSMFLDNELKKLNINRQLEVSDNNFCKFSDNYLGAIKSLSITGLSDINFLEYLPNLKELHIISDDYSDVTLDGSYECNPYFNSIKDFKVIHGLTKLKTLEITNDVNLLFLNLSKLKNLNTLVLKNNPRLKILFGMDKLHYLESVIMVSNPIKQFPNFFNYLMNTVDARTNIIDIDSYLTSINNQYQAEKLYECALTGLIGHNVEFAEKSGFMDYNSLDIKEMSSYYINLSRKLKRDHVFEKDLYGQIAYLFDYGIKLPFAENELEKRDDFYDKTLKEYNGKVPVFFQRRMNYLHSGYTTYLRKVGNCEGIVNLLHVMASILNIDSQTVHCHDKRSNSLSANHALLRINFSGKWHYYDPTYNRDNSFLYYDMGKDEVDQYADLSKIEEIITDRGNNYEHNNGKSL